MTGKIQKTDEANKNDRSGRERFRSVPFLRSNKTGAASPLCVNGKYSAFGKDFGIEFVSYYFKTLP